jgi:hypothetical protein
VQASFIIEVSTLHTLRARAPLSPALRDSEQRRTDCDDEDPALDPCEKDRNVSEPLPIASFKLNLPAGRVRVVPARDLSGCPFAGPGVDLVGTEAATAIGIAALIVAWLQEREPIVIRTLSLDVNRRRLLVTVVAKPRPRVVRVDPSIDASASAERRVHQPRPR